MIDYNSMTKETLIGLLEDTLEYAEEKDKEIERLNFDKEQLNSLVNSCQQEIRRLKEELERLDAELKRYKSIVWLCEKVKDCDKE